MQYNVYYDRIECFPGVNKLGTLNVKSGQKEYTGDTFVRFSERNLFCIVCALENVLHGDDVV